MDASPPFAADAERLKLLYRLPLAGSEKRILVLGSVADAHRLLDIEACGAEVVAGAADGPAPSEPFDAVLLPLRLLRDEDDGIGSLAQRPVSALLRRAHEATRPGGVVIGHLDHVMSLSSLRAMMRGKVSWSGWRAWAGAGTGSACLKRLQAAGFAEAECFYVEPRIAAPMSIVPLATPPARAHFLRAIRRTHGHYTTLGYALRMLLAYVGLAGALQPQLFFWARRPC